MVGCPTWPGSENTGVASCSCLVQMASPELVLPVKNCQEFLERMLSFGTLPRNTLSPDAQFPSLEIAYRYSAIISGLCVFPGPTSKHAVAQPSAQKNSGVSFPGRFTQVLPKSVDLIIPATPRFLERPSIKPTARLVSGLISFHG